MVRVAIYGASGYAGLELLRLLARHPAAEPVALVSRQTDAPHLSTVHPSLAGVFDLRLEALSTDEVAERCDCVFACLPHAASAEVVGPLAGRGLKVVDLSADYRLSDAAVYQRWYGVSHPDPARLGGVPYGLPERFRDAIRGASLVANPGCYPTSAILPLAPLLEAGLICADGIVIDAKSGVSGAGRNAKPHLHFAEANESFAAYGVGSHRHMPEIDQELTRAAGQPVEVLFTPHLVPMNRGILSTIYAEPAAGVAEADVTDALRDAYADEPFVRIVAAPPATADVAHTNRCHIAARVCRGRVVLVSVIDNLVKGAAGAAVQNFNLMHGLEETTALV
ncbi:MAG: N-acetyl-gamma-glutamyl-phosphate reductase [Planctomycetota bacterium]